MDADEQREQIERKILQIIEEKLSNGQMDAERAKAIARFVLEKLHPPLTLEQIYAIAPTLDDEFTELAEAVQPVIHEHDDKVRAVVANHAENLIKSGKFAEAEKLLKDALQSRQ